MDKTGFIGTVVCDFRSGVFNEINSPRPGFSYSRSYSQVCVIRHLDSCQKINSLIIIVKLFHIKIS